MDADNKNIPINRLRDESMKDFQVKRFCQGTDWHHLAGLPVHRDDCYLFILLERGAGTMNIDFKEVRMEGCGLCIVRPGQIHHNIRGTGACGWLLRADGACFGDGCLKALEDILFRSSTFSVPEDMMADCVSLIKMLDKCLSEERGFPLKGKVAGSLLDTFLHYAVAACMTDVPEPMPYGSRQEQICGEFRKLLGSNVILSKSPSFYAGRLCISEAYLNEVVKRSTGFNVSWWIRDRVILEAKRLLSFTGQTVRQVANALGYDDHIYFTRLFKRHTGMTPSDFRRDYHK